MYIPENTGYKQRLSLPFHILRRAVHRLWRKTGQGLRPPVHTGLYKLEVCRIVHSSCRTRGRKSPFALPTVWDAFLKAFEPISQYHKIDILGNQTIIFLLIYKQGNRL